MKRRRVTISDVAHEAEVSLMTVSRVLNRKGRTSTETRRRVQSAIDRLGYRPSAIARGLATRRTRTIGVMVPDIANPFFPEIVQGIEAAALQEGYTIVVCSSGESDAREAAILRRFEEAAVDGIILCSVRMPEAELFPFVRRHRAAVLVNRDAPDDVAVEVAVDDAHGAFIATRHLLDAGHGAIGVLCGPERARSARRRIVGHRDALVGADLRPDADLLEIASPDEHGGQRAAVALLERRPEVTALLCYNDLVAVGALRACRARGLRVPEDVAVVGCDDIPLAGLVTPALTTLRSAKDALGRDAARHLVGALEGREAPGSRLLRPELIVRASAPAAHG